MGLAEPESDEDMLAVPLALADALAVCVGPDEPLPVAVEEPEAEADDVGLWDGGGLPDGVGEADPVALVDAPAVREALALVDPDCEVSALAVELALADPLGVDDRADEVLADGVRELEEELDED